MAKNDVKTPRSPGEVRRLSPSRTVTADAYNVFISWSGPRSKKAAELIREWLPSIIQAARPWMSATEIEKGTRWREEISTALDTMKAGIICLTPENLTAEWLLFEAGALSKARDPQTRVWTYLLADLKPRDVKEPLATFQWTTAEKEDTRKLIHSINKNLDAGIDKNRLDLLFNKLWPDLEKDLAAIHPPSSAAPAKRSSDELAAESLELLRTIAPQIQEISTEAAHARGKRLSEAQMSDYLQSPFIQGTSYIKGIPFINGLVPGSMPDGVTYRLAPVEHPSSTSVTADKPIRKFKSESKAKTEKDDGK